MESTFISVLEDLSIGVISVVVLAYMMIKNNESRERNTQSFLNTLDAMRVQHEKAMNERELAFRVLEKEVRTEILSQLAKNSQTMERVINHLDRK